jgi:hypothetical protein
MLQPANLRDAAIVAAGVLLSVHLGAACTGTLGGTDTGARSTQTTGGGQGGTGGGPASSVGGAGGAPASSAGGAGSTGNATGSAGTGGAISYPVDAICSPWAAPADPHDQSVVPVEVEPLNPASTKVVLVAGAPSLDHPPGAHEFFAGSAIFAKLLCQTPGVVPVIVKNGWPTSEKVFAGAKAIVFYLDGRDTHPLADPARLAILAPYLQAGAGLVNLHYAVDYNPAVGDQILPWLGGYYRAGYSVNPVWQATYSALPAHEAANGLVPFTVNDEWYYDMWWVSGMAGVTPILQAVPPDATRTTPDTQANLGRSETTAWAYDRPGGGRGFGFTGGHWHGNWTDSVDTPDAAKLRRVVINGILWTAHVPVPAGGAPVDFDPANGGSWLDTK